jgi:hypothetical protein
MNINQQITALLISGALGGLYPSLAMEPISEQNQLTKLDHKIKESYRALKYSKSNWSLYNGSDKYNICNMDEHKAFKSIIMNNPNQKEFYALEIGAGKFQWGRALLKYLQEQTDLPTGIKVHIIGVRGEQHFNQHSEFPQDKDARFIVHELGGFKIEDMHAAFIKKGFDLRNKIDLIVSHYTLRHLVNPAQTLLNAYDLCRAETGIMLFDGFHFLQGDQDQNIIKSSNVIKDLRTNFISLLLKMESPFLILPTSSPKENHYLIKKSNRRNSPITLNYKALITVPEFYEKLNIASSCMTVFHGEPIVMDIPEDITDYNTRGDSYYGDRELFNWVITDDLQSPYYVRSSFVEFPLNKMTSHAHDHSMMTTLDDLNSSQLKPEVLLQIIRKQNEKMNKLKCDNNGLKTDLDKQIDQANRLNFDLEMKIFDKSQEVHALKMKIIETKIDSEAFREKNKLIIDLRKEKEALEREKSAMLALQNNPSTPDKENCAMM